MTDVEVNVIESVTLDLAVDRAGDDIARRKFAALVIVGHEPVTGLGVDQYPAFAAHCFGDEEILDRQIVQAGRMELHEFHVRYAAARTPGHCDPVPGRASRCGRIEVSSPRPAGGKDRRPGKQRFDQAGLAVVGVQAVDRARGGEVGRMTASDQVNRDHVRNERDVGVRDGGLLKRLLDRPAGGVRDMDDAAVAVATLPSQMPPLTIFTEVERHAKRCEPGDGGGGFGHDMLDDGAVVEPRARVHRVADVVFEGVAILKDCSDAPLRPTGCAFVQGTLGDYADLEGWRKRKRGGQPGSARADDQNVEIAQAASARVSARKTSSKSGSRVETSIMPSPAAPSAASTSPALTRSLR